MSSGLYSLIVFLAALTAVVVLLLTQTPVPAAVWAGLSGALGWAVKSPGDLMSRAPKPTK